MKPVYFSRHALQQMSDRGASRDDVEAAIASGKQLPARQGR
ncbi:MAG: DUF4258 domain-containing protein [SAR202 cluster bacterium]|nr:DUF4258 domain-containing protein [SAR202 cluster bacterium]